MFTPDTVILPGTEGSLIRKELALAFGEVGCDVRMPDPARLLDADYALNLHNLLDGKRCLYFSINGSGLTPLREKLELLTKADCRVVIWFVDNPWNILSGIREPLWRALPLFVTDNSFIAPLKANGAENVRHLPLAASFAHFSLEREDISPPPASLAPVVFVGRSAFPNKARFFADIALPTDTCRESEALLAHGQRPDLLWWQKHLRINDDRLWPGREARQAACGAEEANLQWRSLCLSGAASAGRAYNAMTGLSGPGLDIFGDAGWVRLLPPGIRLRPPVDYYTRLPGIYRQTAYSLCLTSLQLPQGLNQRHFDVWAAGGCCLSDNTPGLELFPRELTAPIRFRTPGDIFTVMEKIERQNLRPSLISGWQACLREQHTYAHRAQLLFDSLQ